LKKGIKGYIIEEKVRTSSIKVALKGPPPSNASGHKDGRRHHLAAEGW
jgi:hypothetical protein